MMSIFVFTLSLYAETMIILIHVVRLVDSQTLCDYMSIRL
jgi:hypothetical protein